MGYRHKFANTILPKNKLKKIEKDYISESLDTEDAIMFKMNNYLPYNGGPSFWITSLSSWGGVGFNFFAAAVASLAIVVTAIKYRTLCRDVCGRNRGMVGMV